MDLQLLRVRRFSLKKEFNSFPISSAMLVVSPSAISNGSRILITLDLEEWLENGKKSQSKIWSKLLLKLLDFLIPDLINLSSLRVLLSLILSMLDSKRSCLQPLMKSSALPWPKTSILEPLPMLMPSTKSMSFILYPASNDYLSYDIFFTIFAVYKIIQQ